jgi:hypothetical protein
MQLIRCKACGVNLVNVQGVNVLPLNYEPYARIDSENKIHYRNSRKKIEPLFKTDETDEEGNVIQHFINCPECGTANGIF